jgi:hypothetical protein
MSEYWFRPKEKGIGAGVPISWKGWALFLAYVCSILAVPRVLQFVIGYEGSVPLRLACVGVISAPFLYVAWRKTEGGWRWRRGGEEADDTNPGQEN